MKIAFFSDTWAPNKDGVVTTMRNYRAELERRGHEVFIFASSDSKTIRQNKDRRAFLFASVPFPPYPQYKIAIYPLTSISIVRKKKMELVHCHGIASMGLAALTVARDLNLPSMATFHTLIPSGTKVITKSKLGQQIAAKIAWKAMLAFYRRFDTVTSPSRVMQAALAEHGIPSTVVPNAVDTRRFHPGINGRAVRSHLGLKKGERLVLVAGRASREKNSDVLIRAVKRVPDAKLVIVGEGPARKELMQLALKEGLAGRVSFTGLISDAELAHYYAACDVFATASTFETQGLALLEAMACGKPVVGANAMAIPEAVHDGKNGFLFRPFDERDCAEKIEKALHVKNYSSLSKNARKTAEQFSIPASTTKLLGAYDKLLRETGR